MRKACLDCARKHLAQACVLIEEAHLGYPVHAWLAVGHMAEASSELFVSYPEQANKVRDERIKLMKDPYNYLPPFLELIEELNNLAMLENAKNQ